MEELVNHYGISVDISVNENMRINEMILEVLKGLNLTLTSIENILVKIKRSGKVLTQRETLKDGNVRNGDVIILV
ncbi:MAG: hypothetical protein ACK5LZ_04300 [Anaerorhabdus sp.]